jgi:FlaA1/EpsC-like NDP-sugar epimerase
MNGEKLSFFTLPDQLYSLAQQARRRYPVPIIISDLMAFLPAFWAAGLLRNEVDSVELPWKTIVQVALVSLVIFVTTAHFLHLYRDRYRVGTFDEIFVLGITWTAAGLLSTVLNLLIFNPRAPISVVAIGMMHVGVWLLGTRAVWRLVIRSERRPDPTGRKRVLVFGAGEGGESVIKSMLNDPTSRYVPIGIIDDDDRKQNRSIEGIRVLGGTKDIPLLASRADLLLIAIPTADASLITTLSETADDAGLEVLILPSTTDLFGLMATMDAARPLEVIDLLGRAEVEIDNQSVANYLAGAVVLVTGAGGSIGSELCRQILQFHPAKLIMLDRDETTLQSVQMSIDGNGLLDNDNLVLADIRDREGLFKVFEKHNPSVVFHAAALKHLPLLETHPREGLLTNVFGTKNVLDAAASVGIAHFVNISTDKAANPTSVLGTTKRLAEALTVETGAKYPGDYISVRFGNVIGSRGSVLPVFEAQIAAGKPLTVTHPDVTRYFMSIPEASRLVLQAGAIGRTGETLVLDMGDPIKIVDLANQLIRHHKSNVNIVFTGLRLNEKLTEVLAHDGEIMNSKQHHRIWHTEAAVVGMTAALNSLMQTDPADLPERLLAATQPHPSLSGAIDFNFFTDRLGPYSSTNSPGVSPTKTMPAQAMPPQAMPPRSS